MKKILFFLALLILTGCAEQRKEYQNSADSVYIITAEGHKYVIFEGYCKGGIVHAESCPCKGGIVHAESCPCKGGR